MCCVQWVLHCIVVPGRLTHALLTPPVLQAAAAAAAAAAGREVRGALAVGLYSYLQRAFYVALVL